MKKFCRILALGAHPDDIELGCGGYLSRLEREGAEISAIAFSRADQSLPSELAKDTLEREFHAAMEVLGPRSNGTVGRVPVRHFPEHRQEILETLVEVNRDFDPDLVLTMNSRDTHQDHEVVHNETVRAFRGKSILGYEIPWNQQQNVIELFIELGPEDVERKIEMIGMYESQAALGRPYMDPEYVRSAATFRGFQSRAPLAEAYEVITMNWRL